MEFTSSLVTLDSIHFRAVCILTTKATVLPNRSRSIAIFFKTVDYATLLAVLLKCGNV
jgi:hypothetical protein